VASAPGRVLRRHIPDDEIFWALRDISFELYQGDVLGVIGRNGAGKSTLLKILSRITDPTEGRAEVHGRVGSLLEVGTGFHPELTGSENIYLNGAILGMKRAEITNKFDEIVAFAGVESFIDTPVKHYSSGMFMRLAFSVAAHLEAEMLMVDEVLAVGDAEFQKRCLNKMGSIAQSGRTVLLVSHNMASIANLCASSLLLHEGHLDSYGPTSDIIDRYMQLSNYQNGVSEMFDKTRFIERMRLVNDKGETQDVISAGDPLSLEITLKNTHKLATPQLAVFICNHVGDRLFMLSNDIQGRLSIPHADRVSVRVDTGPLNLLPGYYTIDIGIGGGYDRQEHLQNALGFSIEYADVFKTGKLPNSKQGILAQRAQWSILD
jgi:lipopolysaccharide transport system ATP-binding protein